MKTFLYATFYMVFSSLNSICYSQIYKFDKIIKDNIYNQYVQNTEETKLFNSEDDSYHMQLYYRNDTLVSYIYDRKKNEIHYFHVEKSDSLTFNYISTKKLNEKLNENKFEFSHIKEKKGNKEVTLKIFDKKNNKIAQFQLFIKETNKNYFPIIKFSFLETEIYNKTKPPFNFIILEAKGRNETGQDIKYKLLSIEDIVLKITIPH